MSTAALVSLAAGLCAAVAFGAAAVLQGLATREQPVSEGVDPSLLVRLVRSPAFLASVALNLAGFGLHVVALQALPLFLVQAVIAGSVAVTAVLSVRVVGAVLTAPQWAAVGAVVLGLVLLATTAQTSEETSAGTGTTLLLLGTVVVALGASLAAARVPGPGSAVLLGLLGGVAYGVVALSARLLPDFTVRGLLTSLDTYVLLVAGAVAFLLYSTAMQRGSVTTTTAALVITQTFVPTVVGVVALGDAVRDGLVPLAVLGFCLALGGALGLARFEGGAPHPAQRQAVGR